MCGPRTRVCVMGAWRSSARETLGESSPGPNGFQALTVQAAARREASSASAPSLSPPRTTLERHAEQFLEAAQDERAGEQCPSALLLDAETERDVFRRCVREHVDRVRKLVRPELASFESPERTRTAAYGERRLDRRRLEPLDVARDLGACPARPPWRREDPRRAGDWSGAASRGRSTACSADRSDGCRRRVVPSHPRRRRPRRRGGAGATPRRSRPRTRGVPLLQPSGCAPGSPPRPRAAPRAS